jgi:predicted esterase
LAFLAYGVKVSIVRGVRRLCAFLAVIAVLLLTLVGGESVAWAKTTHAVADAKRLEVPGYADAFYYRPRGRGMKPVLVYLHGRGGNPSEDCRKWAHVATQFGWVLCPSGPEDRGEGARGWSNNAPLGGVVVKASLDALRTEFKRRVQLRGNVLIGFSEGAFVAMQVGLRDPQTWSRWLILAANDQYWWGDAKAMLTENRRRIRRVYLLTGETDEVAPNTLRVADILKDAKIPHKIHIAPGMGHEVPADRMRSTYRRPLAWLLAHS